ncbi:ATP-grasp domain-containing protein [Kitasatospora sp. NPDC052896]|uniref:ATP-grasp domain-containing protein n=1 Tax=Kitasatospora sp. NPDC052896 TaxID=3364061 RepID=UPI0037C9F247
MARTAREHVLVIGAGRDLAARMRARTDVRTTTLVRITRLAKVARPADNERIIALPADAPGEWLAHAGFVHSCDPVDRVAAFSELDQDKAAAIADLLGLPFHSARTVRNVTDKLAMRRALAEAAVEQVCCAEVFGPDEVTALLQRWGTLVLKPTGGTGSRGVSIVRTAADVQSAWRWSAGDGRSPITAEQYLDGQEFSVEAFSEDGDHEIVAITRKFKDDRHLVETGHQVPAGLPDESERAVARHVAAVLDALGVRNGPTHTEVILTAAGPRTVETHLRLGGDSIPELVADATGVDLFDFTARQAGGRRVLAELRHTLARTPKASAAIWFVGADDDGVLTGVNGLELAREQDGVVDVQLTKGIGEPVSAELADSESRVLYCRAVHAEPARALAVARAAAERVMLLTETAATLVDGNTVA